MDSFSHTLSSRKMKPLSQSSSSSLFSLKNFMFLVFVFSIRFILSLMTIKGGTHQACAVCKYQRRKCTKECPLSPYFPGDQPKLFQNAHRLFGVKNIMKILKQVPDDQKEEAMKSIVYQSDMRARFPVHGCLGIIRHLQFQLQSTVQELRYVKTQLAILRSNQSNNYDPQHLCSSQQSQFGFNDAMFYQNFPSSSGGGGGGGGGGGAGMSSAAAANEFFLGNQENPQQFADFSNNMNGHSVFVEMGHEGAKPISSFVQFPCDGDTGGGTELQFLDQIPNPAQQEMQVSYDFDELAGDSIADDRDSFAESKEAVKSSLESSLNHTTQFMIGVTKNEVGNVATRLSLTTIK